jgi:hypothetical protein
MRALLLSILAILAGCAGAHAHQVTGPDGENNWFSITCRRSHGNCYEKASDVCPDGYIVADSSGHEGMYVNANAGYAVSTYNGEMLIKCKGEPYPR